MMPGGFVCTSLGEGVEAMLLHDLVVGWSRPRVLAMRKDATGNQHAGALRLRGRWLFLGLLGRGLLLWGKIGLRSGEVRGGVQKGLRWQKAG